MLRTKRIHSVNAIVGMAGGGVLFSVDISAETSSAANKY